MNRLSTTFAGLPLRNPIIVSSSGLTDTAAKCLALEEAGAGAAGVRKRCARGVGDRDFVDGFAFYHF